MPDVFGYDARTRLSKSATFAAASYLGAAARAAYDRYSMAPIPKSSAKARLRISYGRRSRRRYGRRVVKRKGASYKRRGTRAFGTRKRALYRKLDTNMRRNDVRTLRGVYAFIKGVEVTEGTPASNNQTFSLNAGLFNQFALNRTRFTEYRLSRVQYVIEPRSVVTGATNIAVQNQEIPYLAVRTTTASGLTQGNLLAEDIRRTPGYAFVPLQRKRRTIINLTPSLTLETEVEQAGLAATTARHVSMPWLNCRTGGDIALGRLEVRRPGLAVQGGQALHFDVRVYATIQFRGNVEEMVAPIVPQ